MQTPKSGRNGGGVFEQLGGHLTASQGQCTTARVMFFYSRNYLSAAIKLTVFYMYYVSKA